MPRQSQLPVKYKSERNKTDDDDDDDDDSRRVGL